MSTPPSGASQRGQRSPSPSTPPNPGRDWVLSKEAPAARVETITEKEDKKSDNEGEESEAEFEKYKVDPPTQWDPPGPEVTEQTKDFITSAWTHYLGSAKADVLFKEFPRPENLPVIRKTALNEEIKKDLKSSDDELASILYANQFAATPLIRLMDEMYVTKASGSKQRPSKESVTKAIS